MLTIAHKRAIIRSSDIMNNKKDLYAKKEYEPGVYVLNEKMKKEVFNVRMVLGKLFDNAIISMEKNFFDEYGVIVRAVMNNICIKGEREKRLFERAIKNAEYVEIIPLNDNMAVIDIGFTDLKIRRQDI